jgi:hypothetical protein
MKLVTIVVGAVLASTAALGDEVTTMTTTRTQEPGRGVYAGLPAVGFQFAEPSRRCRTQRRTTTDPGTGASGPVTHSDC